MAAPAPIRRAEGFYRELELVRIQWSKPEELGLAVALAEARRGARPSAPATSCFALEAALRPNSRHDDAPCPLSPFPHSLHPLSLFCLSPSLIPGCTETADEYHRSHQHPHAQPVRPRAPPWIREALPRRTRRRVP